MYSSATTGRPKGVLCEPVAPDRLDEAVRLLLEYFAVAPGGRTLIPAPFHHASPSRHAVLALAAGLDITLMPRFDAEEFLRLIEAHRIEQVQVVPTMFVWLLRLPKDVRGGPRPRRQAAADRRDRRYLPRTRRQMAAVHLPRRPGQARRHGSAGPARVRHHRRHRPSRRGRLPLPRRPPQRHGRLRRRQHLPRGDRGCSARPRRGP
ncbi:AMP-binding protein [Streptomyces inhibens]|uniref:AMP-binding protein n=1 Tax=Streptomyces inhibens TaxID=2293571 RepID=UPI0037AE37A2